MNDERQQRMNANKRRLIRDGSEFDHLFPPPRAEDEMIKAKAGVEDTMALIQRTVPLTRWHTEKIAKKLKGKTLEETCANIWHFVYNHIQYKRDKDGVEQVRSPRRTWWERKTGVDCDCYTEFISSILLNLGIPHKARITKYPKRYETPRWQHVYPIVPKSGREHKHILNRDDYIVLDCVKDDFDDEQPYLECKDYDMRLDYLDGIDMPSQRYDEQEEDDEIIEFKTYDNVDLSDLASLYDDEEMGSIFKKIGKAIKKTVKKVGDKVGDGIRFINRYANPATVLLRNGFLLAMKINLMNVAGKLRYAYLTDAQAQSLGINLNELKKLRKIKDRAETVYWQAGGKKENLKKAILKGKGNKDKKVALSGLDGLDNVYMDEDEYNIIHSDDLEGLGELASGTAIAAATSAVAAIAGALKQVKGLFTHGGKDEQVFQSETDNAGTAASAPATIPEDEDAITNADVMPEKTVSSLLNKLTTVTNSGIVSNLITPRASAAPSSSTTTASTAARTATPVATQDTAPNVPTTQVPQPVTPAPSTSTQALTVPESTTTSVTTQEQNNDAKNNGFFQKTGTWVKENPGKSLLMAGGILTGGYLLIKAMKGNSGTHGLDGVPRKKPNKRKQTRRKQHRKTKVKPQNLL